MEKSRRSVPTTAACSRVPSNAVRGEGGVDMLEVPSSPLQARAPDIRLTLVLFGAEALRTSEFALLAATATQALLEKPTNWFGEAMPAVTVWDHSVGFRSR